MLEIFDQANEIRAHADFFEQGTPDTEWIASIGKWSEKPVIIAGDGRILRNPAEQQILKSCNVMFVFLASGWTNLGWDDWAWKLIKVWPDIVRNTSKVLHPTVFKVGVSNLKVQQKFRTSEIPGRA